MFKTLTRNAGFGTEGPGHSSQVDLTEAQAAAVDTLKNGVIEYGIGDIFLSVDAGGGTIDLALVRVTAVENGIAQMSQIAEVSGIGVGSTVIDSRFKDLVTRRLSSHPSVLDGIPDLPEAMMMSERFKTIKHHFGEPSFMSPTYKVPVPGLAYNFSHQRLGIEEGRMVFQSDEIQALFDDPVQCIIEKIKQQLDWLAENQPGEEVRLETGDRPVMARYIARASYGVVVREIYNPERHFNEDIIQDDYNTQQRWAINQIQWIILKGDSVDPNEPLVKQFVIRLHPGQVDRSWNSQIVISRNEVDVLPRSLRQGVQDHELVLREKRGFCCFRQGYKYYDCNFQVHVIVAPADIRFELWFKGQRFSRNHDPIKVSWDK
ncbi:related to hsp70 protein [Fusarium torulosum]|uniref:Related to hsp70 protein n=1 Tax=Fusarium torulosum TaxID=33205 RepID=A0AAE8MND8_9HYPO|nr:related to hsp70 protein [Fusarium torulosum]